MTVAFTLVERAAESALLQVLGWSSSSVISWWSCDSSTSHEGDNEDGGELGELHFDCCLGGVLKLEALK